MFWLWLCLAVYVVVFIAIYLAFRSGRDSSLPSDDSRWRNSVIALLALFWPIILVVALIDYCLERGID